MSTLKMIDAVAGAAKGGLVGICLGIVVESAFILPGHVAVSVSNGLILAAESAAFGLSAGAMFGVAIAALKARGIWQRSRFGSASEIPGQPIPIAVRARSSKTERPAPRR